MSQTAKTLLFLTADRPGLAVLHWLAGRVPSPLMRWLCMGCPTMHRGDSSMSSFLPREPLFTQHRAGWRAAQWCCWASVPNIDVILLISTLSLLLISLISAWSAGEQQQTELFFLSCLLPSYPTDSHIFREEPSQFFFPVYSVSPLHQCSWLIDQSCVNTAEILSSWSAQSHRVSRSFSSLVAEFVLQQSDHEKDTV